MNNLTEEIASTHLGKKSKGSESYDSSLLVVIPREENRHQYEIDCNLPFKGFDVWHCYEFSTMTNAGLPVTRVLKIKYDCENEYIVESKSLKLYLNSFNMSKFGENIEGSLNICKEKIKQDLSDQLKTPVETNFLDEKTEKAEIFKNYKNLLDYIDEQNLKIEHYKEAPDVLECSELKEIHEYYLKFDSLRSNCRVTHQPDFGDVFIYYKSTNHISEESLVKYLSSFRSEYHFHEECCEMIFKRLYDILGASAKLFVCAMYTRRGGIDISPVRWSKNFTPPEVEVLSDITKFVRNGIKQ